MEWTNILLLLGSGLAAGFIAGLIGIGGGVIFAPVLFFYFQSIGIDPDVVTQLTLGSSLLCTLVAALASAWHQYARAAVHLDVALRVGLFSAAVIYLMSRFVTTQPWYDGTVFQVVFSVVLLVVVARMVLSRPPAGDASGPKRDHALPLVAGAGVTAGAVSTATGVGGGVVLVPIYHNLMHLPMQEATGTSSATIVLISLLNVITYAWMGWGEAVPATAVGYVDVWHAFILCVPAVLTARLGVWTAHRIDTKALRWCFALIAVVVVVRLLLRALA